MLVVKVIFAIISMLFMGITLKSFKENVLASEIVGVVMAALFMLLAIFL